MPASVHSLEERRERIHQEQDRGRYLADFVWPAYDEVVTQITLFPPWLVLKLMSECRRQLAMRDKV